MNESSEDLNELLGSTRHRWLVTGAAGFIGSNLLEALLLADQDVIGIDNFSTGHRRNLEIVENRVGRKFHFIEGDVREPQTCALAVQGVDFVLHQAALGSVPRSLVDPLATHESNATGFLNMLIAARDSDVKRFVYAASSSTYGDFPGLPKEEDKIGAPLSPYAVTKYLNELYADVFCRSYGMKARGLRYFNVFGPRQDPNGAYAAVIPLWVASMIRGEEVFINGDGETSRDFCYVQNAVQANVRAALVEEGANHEVYNVAVGTRTSLSELYSMIKGLLRERYPHLEDSSPTFQDFRAGDVRHSQASIKRAARVLGYAPTHTVADGLRLALDWYVRDLG